MSSSQLRPVIILEIQGPGYKLICSPPKKLYPQKIECPQGIVIEYTPWGLFAGGLNRKSLKKDLYYKLIEIYNYYIFSNIKSYEIPIRDNLLNDFIYVQED